IALALIGLMCLHGCSKSDDANPGASSTGETLPETLFLAQVPTGIQTISQLKEDAKAGDEVVIKAIIGGAKKAFVADRAVMTVVDATLNNKCLVEDDHCPTPWDYCCASAEELLPEKATIQITGTGTTPLKVDLGSIPQLKPLNTLVIKGTVGPRPDKSTLVIHATGIFVEHQES
ncbi:MAG: hypothetical protein GY809_33190, partial [Planctomycetes bacterium]|nr:hypothetical protein [Planctomycetota bacterium]